jgi:hypothetical protein
MELIKPIPFHAVPADRLSGASCSEVFPVSSSFYGLPHGLFDRAIIRLALEEAVAVGELHKRRHLLRWGLLSVHARSIIDVGGVKLLPE